MYDCTNRSSFQHLAEWLTKLKSYGARAARLASTAARPQARSQLASVAATGMHLCECWVALQKPPPGVLRRNKLCSLHAQGLNRLHDGATNAVVVATKGDMAAERRAPAPQLRLTLPSLLAQAPSAFCCCLREALRRR